MTKQTALHAEHEKLGTTFTDFGGWDMPLKYGSELAEHRAVREAAGIFDLSHMGEIWVSGSDAATFLNTALVGDLAAVKVGRAKYSLICNDSGGIIDDLITYRIDETRFLVVPNAGNTLVVAEALRERTKGFDVTVDDASAETSLIAVQGPASEAIVREVVQGDAQRTAVSEMPNYSWITVMLAGIEVLLARTGYTGEDGFELYVPNESAVELWSALLVAGEPHGLTTAGLAARDSLRLEAGMPLYGNELSIDSTPFEAGLEPVVSFKKVENFVGREALAAVKEAGPERVLVGLKGLGRRAGRAGYAVFEANADGTPGNEIGRITSGQPSPTLGFPIAIASVDPAHSQIGRKVYVDLRGRQEPFEVVALPFYSRQN